MRTKEEEWSVLKNGPSYAFKYLHDERVFGLSTGLIAVVLVE